MNSHIEYNEDICLCNLSINLSNDLSKKFNPENFTSSTPISPKIDGKNDSAYSSFVSQKTYINVATNTSLLKDNIANNGSPATSYSSRNSALNDDELEEFFKSSEIVNSIDVEAEKSGGRFFISELFSRRSARNSPWTVRPDSAPLNEEEEDSDKEASNYFCSYKEKFSNLTDPLEISENTIHSRIRMRHASMTDAEQRNELIATKLRQIADNLPAAHKKALHKSCTLNNDRYSSYNRHSHSSFSEMMPNGMGSALDLIVSLFNIYKHHSKQSSNQSFSNSQSMHMLKSHRRLNYRNRSYTE